MVFKFSYVLLDFSACYVCVSGKRDVEVSTYDNGLIYVSLQFSQFCFMQCEALLLSVYTLRIVESSRRTDLFIIVEYLYPYNFPSSKSSPSEINRTSARIFKENFISVSMAYFSSFILIYVCLCI